MTPERHPHRLATVGALAFKLGLARGEEVYGEGLTARPRPATICVQEDDMPADQPTIQTFALMRELRSTRGRTAIGKRGGALAKARRLGLVEDDTLRLTETGAAALKHWERYGTVPRLQPAEPAVEFRIGTRAPDSEQEGGIIDAEPEVEN